jgi:hypothetical protein
VKVYDHLITDDLSYAQGLLTIWAKGHDIVIVEQDMAVRVEQVGELFMCDRPFCAYDYKVSKHQCWSQVTYAVGLGLARITAEAQRTIKSDPPVPQVPWTDLASELGTRLPDVHVHYPPADHRHAYT